MTSDNIIPFDLNAKETVRALVNYNLRVYRQIMSEHNATDVRPGGSFLEETLESDDDAALERREVGRRECLSFEWRVATRLENEGSRRFLPHHTALLRHRSTAQPGPLMLHIKANSGCDGAPSETISRIKEENPGQYDLAENDAGGFHQKLKFWGMRGRIFEDTHLYDMTFLWRDSQGKVRYDDAEGLP